jgi:hypothetical protein
MKLYKLLPFESLLIQSRLTQEDAIKKLAEVVEIERTSMFSVHSTKPYKGKIQGHKFTLTRTIRGRNSFLPVINGQIIPDIDGSLIKIYMELHIAVLIFIAVWLSPFIIGFLSLMVIMFVYLLSLIFPNSSQVQDIITSSQIKPGVSLIFSPLSLAIPIFFAYGLPTLIFKSEASNSKAFFLNLFN